MRRHSLGSSRKLPLPCRGLRDEPKECPCRRVGVGGGGGVGLSVILGKALKKRD